MLLTTYDPKTTTLVDLVKAGYDPNTTVIVNYIDAKLAFTVEDMASSEKKGLSIIEFLGANFRYPVFYHEKFLKALPEKEHIIMLPGAEREIEILVALNRAHLKN